jgi:hypothetical protein
MTSIWAGGGGYLDFNQQDVSNNKGWVLVWWSTGTVLTASVMALSMFYITVEWCQQSFLSTEDYGEAMKGLHMTRNYRSLTFFMRRISRAVLWATLDQLERLAKRTGVIRKRQNTLLWTKEHTWDPDIPRTATSTRHDQHNASPATELTTTATTPAMPHSVFPPTINIRDESDDPLPSSSLLSRPRPSDESSAPLIPRPSHAGEAGGRKSSNDGRVSFETPFLEHEPRWRDTTYNRPSHERGNSDAGLLPNFGGDMGQGGLGLRFDDIDVERGIN